MARSERCTRSGWGWLLIMIGVLAAGAGLLAWLVRLELDEADRAKVWITDTGTRYHRRECGSLSRSDPRQISLAEARQTGLTPCELCEPST